MTQDEIIEMARQAGMVYREFEDEFANANTDGVDLKTMTAFYKLVADKKDAEHKEAMRWDVHSCGPTCKRYACVATREAVKAEREACAKVSEAKGLSWKSRHDINPDNAEKAYMASQFIASAIRARGEA